MTSRRLFALCLTLIVLAACGSTRGRPEKRDDGFFALAFSGSAPSEAQPPPPVSATQTDAFAVELAVERGDGGDLLTMPRLTVLPGQIGNVSMLNQCSYIADYAWPDKAKPPDAVVKTLQDGLQFQVCAQRTTDGAVSLGFRISLTNATRPIDVIHTTLQDGPPIVIQRPEVERSEVEGARRIEPGVRGLLARIPSPDGSGPMLVLARVTAVRVDASTVPVEGGATDSHLIRPVSGGTLHLHVGAVRVARHLEPGTVLDDTATPGLMKSGAGRVLRDFEVHTCVDSRVRIAGLLDFDGKTRGLLVEGRDDGTLALSWTTTSGARTATVRPTPGRRFVALSGIAGGGTAGVLVSADAD